MTLWHGRFEAAPADELMAFTASLPFDRRLAADDVAGSRAHVAGLVRARILTKREADAIGTALAQQSLRHVLSFCNARQMTAPEAYIQYSPEVFTEEGEVTNDATADFLRGFMSEFRDHVARVLTVLPRSA